MTLQRTENQISETFLGCLQLNYKATWYCRKTFAESTWAKAHQKPSVPVVWQTIPKNPERHWQTPLTQVPRPLHSSPSLSLGQVCTAKSTTIVLKNVHPADCCMAQTKPWLTCPETCAPKRLTILDCFRTSLLWLYLLMGTCLASIPWESDVTLTDTIGTCATSTAFFVVRPFWATWEFLSFINKRKQKGHVATFEMGKQHRHYIPAFCAQNTVEIAEVCAWSETHTLVHSADKGLLL